MKRTKRIWSDVRFEAISRFISNYIFKINLLIYNLLIRCGKKANKTGFLNFILPNILFYVRQICLAELDISASWDCTKVKFLKAVVPDIKSLFTKLSGILINGWENSAWGCNISSRECLTVQDRNLSWVSQNLALYRLMNEKRSTITIVIVHKLQFSAGMLIFWRPLKQLPKEI
jgi:hypothetical protein